MAWLEETLAGPTLDIRLRWHNPPPDWSPGRDGLVVRTAAGTDFWQGTHYGFRVDNGHLFAAEVEGDFVLETEVVAAPVHRYDQAGLMVRLSERCWLKTSVEAATVPGGRWSQIRLGRLHEDEGGRVLAGLYACSPKGEGFAATFKRLRIERT